MTGTSVNPFTLWFVWALLQPAVDNNGFNKWAAKRRYYLRNVETCKSRALAHRRSDAGKQYIRDWQRDRYQQTVEHKIAKNTRTRIWFALRAKRCTSKNVMRLLGCTIPEFKRHIEQQFQPGWSWANWGSVWEIDHIKSCAKFDLSDPVQREACFHFSNQRPLAVFDNRSKGSK